MIAHAPRESGGWRTARNASLVRRARNRRLRYRAIGRIVVTLGGLTCLVLVYLALLANVTRLHYEIGRVQHERTQLVDRTLRYDDEIAQLTTRERLAAMAARLGMAERSTFAVVNVPPPAKHADARPSGVAALFPAVKNFVGAK